MIIDAHIHYGDQHPDFLALLEKFDLKLLNICVGHNSLGKLREQATRYQQAAEAYPNRFAWCTSFALPKLQEPTFDPTAYVESVLTQLDADFAAGAIACKVWKNVGMEVRTASGDFFHVDDPLLTPIFEHLAASGHPLLTHIAEPLACWQPLAEGTPHYGYYSKNPQWHMYNKPEYPSHEALMAARDRVLARHPDLRMIGAHLGSLEYDIDVLAQRLDRYPNFAVDISARLGDLAYQDSAKVSAFFLKYSDRILFGTDVVQRRELSALSDTERHKELACLRARYVNHFAYCETTDRLEVRGQETTGIGLPDEVLEKFYRLNAEAWYPGV